MIAALNVVHTMGSTLMDNIMINLDKIFSSLYMFSYCYFRTNCPLGILIYYVIESCVICLLSILLYNYARYHLAVVMYNYATLV
jgi:hypothetical protein